MGRILIVDDNKGVCSLLKELFTMEGHSAKTCSEIEKVYEKLESFKPDVSIFDIHIGKCDVLEFTKTLKIRHPDMEIIFMSADDPDECFKGQRFIKKPFDIFKVKEYVNKILLERVAV
ncbi:MAG: response regulator [Thermoanaerobacterium sp.]|nr:response regulator [Thermoanaerobacterium sp.]